MSYDPAAERDALMRMFLLNTRYVEIAPGFEVGVCVHCDLLLDLLSGDNEACVCDWHNEYLGRMQDLDCAEAFPP